VNLLSLPDWINLLQSAMQTLQEGFLQALAAVGLAQTSHGQPAWPFAHRLSGDVMQIDHSVARQLLDALGFSVAAAASLTLALLWRRGRVSMLSVTVVLLLCSAWPDPQLLLAPAVPTSFHVSTSAFSAASIVQGQQRYRQQCASCHGLDGKGDTPLGLALETSPPNLTGDLLWRRADGELFWRIAYGMRDGHGAVTMPGLTQQLSDQDLWSLIDFMKANAAGASVRALGSWEQPVALPDLSSDCGQGTLTSIRQWQGQRVRVILASKQQPQGFALDDPRLHSVILSKDDLSLPAARAGAPRIDCLSHSAQAWQAISIITGIASEQLAGTELLTDRDGWLRARKLPEPGKVSDWSASDILCRAPTDAHHTSGGLDGLIAAMDAEPVRFVRGGVAHTAR